MKITKDVLVSWTAKITPMVLLALVARGCVTKEQADQITPLVQTMIETLYAVGFAVSAAYTLYRSIRTHGG